MARAVIDIDPREHGSWRIILDNLILMPGYLLFMPIFFFILGPILAPLLDERGANIIAYWGLTIVSAMSYAGVLIIILKLVSMWRNRRARVRGVSP